MDHSLVRKELRKYTDSSRAKSSMWFFKTRPGEYGEGDVFLGVTVPDQRKIAKKYSSLPLSEIKILLRGKYHEERLTSLFILVNKFKSSDKTEKEKLSKFFLKNREGVNNWDLVDSSAPYFGQFIKKDVLLRLAASKNVWGRRIAIMSTFANIRQGKFKNALAVSEKLLGDKHDLIHKAVGWMLREIGNASMETEESFLLKNYKIMPRTMLRYAIEKFPPKKHKFYLSNKLKSKSYIKKD